MDGFLFENPQKEIIPNLINIYVTTDQQNQRDFIERYLSLFPVDEYINNVYLQYSSKNSPQIRTLINNCNLFSPSHILRIAEENIHWALPLCEYNKDFYTREDLNTMKQLLLLFESLPETGKLETQKNIFNGGKDIFICKNGHKTDVKSSDKSKITCDTCKINIKGLYENETKIIETLKERIIVLEDLLQV